MLVERSEEKHHAPPALSFSTSRRTGCPSKYRKALIAAMESSFFVFCRNLCILVLPQMSVPEAFFILADVPTRTPLSNALP
jgi:hypothetical protein